MGVLLQPLWFVESYEVGEYDQYEIVKQEGNPGMHTRGMPVIHHANKFKYAVDGDDPLQKRPYHDGANPDDFHHGIADTTPCCL